MSIIQWQAIRPKSAEFFSIVQKWVNLEPKICIKCRKHGHSSFSPINSETPRRTVQKSGGGAVVIINGRHNLPYQIVIGLTDLKTHITFSMFLILSINLCKDRIIKSSPVSNLYVNYTPTDFNKFHPKSFDKSPAFNEIFCLKT